MSRSIISRIAVAFLVCGILLLSSSPIKAPEENFVSGGEVRSQIRKIRIPFMANEGQVDENVEFYARTFGGTTYIGKDGAIVYAIPGRAAGEARGIGVLKETFVGGRPDHIEGEDRSSTKVNDYRGQDRSKWKTSIPSYETVSLGEVYENIQVKVKARGSSVEKLFFVQPGGKPDDIRVRVTGAKSLHVREDGQLEAATEWGTTGFSKPVAFQYKAGGEKEFVQIAYAVQDNEYGFKAGKYDSNRTLVIDPLLSSTFVGGSDNESIESIVMAGTSVYVAGYTASADFPLSAGASGMNDAFVAKLSGGLTQLETVTLLGGWENDSARAIAAFGGYVYVTGNTRSPDFPAGTWTYGSLPDPYNQNAFVAELNDDLGLLTARFLGGTNDEAATSMAVDGGGHVFIAGYTASSNFPLGEGNVTHGKLGGYDVFVVRLGGRLVGTYNATVVGGASQDQAYAISVHPLNGVYVAGSTSSSDFPTTTSPAYDNLHNGGYDAFVINLINGLQTLNRSTFLGGTGTDGAFALILDSGGDVLVAGQTDSFGFPTATGQYGTSPVISGAAFVSRLNAGLDILGASVTLGGFYSDSASSLALDSGGNVFVAGSTSSWDFPTTTGSYAPGSKGGSDGFVAKLNAGFSLLSASTFLGGSGEDHVGAMALDSSGNLLLAGFTDSPDFLNAYDTIGGSLYAGGTDGFVVKLDSGLSGSSWPMFLHDLAHTGGGSYPGPGSAGLKWSIYGSTGATGGSTGATTGGSTYFRSSPAVGPNGNVVASADWYVMNVTPDGEIRGIYAQSTGAIESSPAVAPDGTIYVGSDDGYLHAINPDLTQKWAFPTGGAIKASPVIGPDGAVYVGSDDGKVYAVQSDGTAKWAEPFTTGGPVRSSPAIGPDGTVYVGSDDGKVYAIQPSGGTHWETPFTTGGPVRGSPVGDVAGNVGYVGSQDGTLYAIDPSSGNLLWSYETGGPIETSPALAADAGGTVYVGSLDGYLYAIRQVDGSPTGAVLWRSLVYPFMSSPAIGSDGTIYVKSFDNRVSAFNPSNGSELWSYETGFSEWPVTRPMVGMSMAPPAYRVFAGPNGNKGGLTPTATAPPPTETVFVGSNDNRLYALSPADGIVTWSTETSGWVTHHSVQGPDGTLYVAASDGVLHAVNPTDGSINWSFNAYAPIVNSIPVIAPDGTIFVLDDYWYLHLINPADGTEKGTSYSHGPWGSSPPPIDSQNTMHVVYNSTQVMGIKTDGSQNPYYTNSESIRSIGLEGGITYLGSVSGISAVSSSSGQLAWSHAAGHVYKIVTSPGGFVYAAAADYSSVPAVYTLYSFNPDGPANPQGAVKWSYATTAPIDSLEVGSDGTPYFSTGNGVAALNPANGAPLWSIPVAGVVSLHPGSDGNLYFGAEDEGEKIFYAVDPADGSEKWPHVTTGMQVSTAPAIGSDGTVYVETDGKEMFAINGSDGSVRWRFLRGPWIVSSPSIGPEQTLYVGSEDGYLYALSDAHLSVDPSSCDFGDVPVYTSSTQMTVTLTNDGMRDIYISWLSVDSSYGSYELTSYFTGDPEPCYGETLSPNETCTTSVTFTPTSMGQSEGTLSIQTNDLSSSYDVLLTGRGLKPVFSVEPVINDFGDVTVGETASTTVTLSNTGNSDLTVQAMTWYGDGVFSRVGGSCGDAPVTIAPGGNCTVVVEFAPLLETTYYAYMDFTTDDLDNPSLYAEFSGNGIAAAVYAEVLVLPVSHDFGVVRLGESSSQEFTITNTGSSELIITALGILYGESSSFTLNVNGGSKPCGTTSPSLPPGAPDNYCTVEVTFAPLDAGYGDYDFLVMHTNDPQHPVVQVDLSGEGGRSEIDVFIDDGSYWQDGYDFGEVHAGSGSSKDFVISNHGSVDLLISQISFSGTGMEALSWSGGWCGNPVPPEGCVIGPQSQQTITVTFTQPTTPIWLGSDDSTALNILSDDGYGNDSLRIPLWGRPFELTLSVSLEGDTTCGVSVASDPGNIACGVDGEACSGPFDEGAVVSLTAAAQDPECRFDHWVVGSTQSSANPLTVTMTQDTSVSAVFARSVEPTEYDLTTVVRPAGSGSVTLSPAGGTYESGTVVTVTANAGSQYLFDHWEGAVTGSTNPATVTMNADKTVRAVFVSRRYTLTANARPVEGGSVSLNPAGGVYDAGTSVTVTVTPAEGYRFDRWTGDLQGQANPASVITNGDKKVVAVFVRQYTLTARARPDQGGSVSLDPAGGVYDARTTITVTATPADGYRFVRWAGDLNGKVSPASIIMEGDKRVAAIFVRQFTLTAKAKPDEGGSVSLDPEGGVYDARTTVTATATPADGYRFVRWAGDLQGDINPASLTMNGDKRVAAVFVRQFTLEASAKPNEGGTVSLDPAGGIYDALTIVRVTATPAEGYRFVRWGGDFEGDTNPASITMNGNKKVVAVFVRQYALTVTAKPKEGGSVSLTPPGGLYDLNKTVTLRAVPAEGYRFVNWTGDLTGTDRPATLVMDGDKSVEAVFAVKEASVTIHMPAASATEPKYKAYRMIGIPVMPADRDTFRTLKAKLGAAYDLTEWRLFRSVRGKLKVIDDEGQDAIRYGKGWWMVCEDAKDITLRGLPLLTDFRISLASGYNIVACPFEDRNVKWSDVLDDMDDSGVNLGATLYYYTGGSQNDGYEAASEMEPGKAYMVWSKAGGILHIKRNYPDSPARKAMRSSGSSEQPLPSPPSGATVLK